MSFTATKNVDAAPDVLTPVTHLLRDLHTGERHAHDFSVDERRAVVEHLAHEGYTNAEIAALLRVSDRTIQRDRHHLRAAGAIFADDPGFTPRLIGEYIRQTEHAISRIRRAVRDPSTPPRDRITAEKVCHDILTPPLARLQSIGYIQSLAAQPPDNTTRPESPRLVPVPPDRAMLEMVLGPRAANLPPDPVAPTPTEEWQIRHGRDVDVSPPKD